LPTERDLEAVRNAAEELELRKAAHTGELSLVPDEMLDVRGIRHTWAMIYGLEKWEDYFTPRQSLSISTLSRLVKDASIEDVDSDLSMATRIVLALAVDKQCDRDSSLCRWISQNENIGYTFARQALGMMWDFVEPPWISSGGGWNGIIEDIGHMIESQSVTQHSGLAEGFSATQQALPDDSAHALITDPPYYDSIPYAYLSDFFYVWLKRTMGHLDIDLLLNQLVPKEDEIVVDRPHELSNSDHDVDFYEKQLTKAFEESRRVLRPDGIGTIVFANKTTSSWEAILKALIVSGWTITSSWPIDTERQARIAAQGQARLAS
jgi:adenine-specific DNA methylase